MSLIVLSALVIWPSFARTATTQALVKTGSVHHTQPWMQEALFSSRKASCHYNSRSKKADFLAGVSPAEAAVATDAVTTAYHAITRRAEVKPTELVFLFGLGGLGFNALQISRHVGARVIVCDIKQSLLEEAIKLGVPKEDVVPIGTSPQDFVEKNNLHIDTVLDFVGTSQTFEDAQYIGTWSSMMKSHRPARR